MPGSPHTRLASILRPMSVTATLPAVLPQANDPCWCGSGRKYKRCHKPPEGRVLPGEVSPMRTVPAAHRPPAVRRHRRGRCAGTSRGSSRPRSSSACATPARSPPRSCGSPARWCAPGITTDEIDVYVHQLCIERGAYPSPLNYHGYPKSVCTSVNEVICHGIPDSRALQDGDIVNLDVTSYIGGVHGDTNATFFVGDVDPASRQLVQVTEECIWYGIEAVMPGRPLSDIGRAIEDHAKKHNYGVVRAFIGHGIGEQFHTDIQVLHYYDPRASMIMRPGMTFTIEPMITLGTVAAPDVGRRLDRGHRRRQAHRPVRAHPPRHRRRRRRAHRRAGRGQPVRPLEPLTARPDSAHSSDGRDRPAPPRRQRGGHREPIEPARRVRRDQRRRQPVALHPPPDRRVRRPRATWPLRPRTRAPRTGSTEPGGRRHTTATRRERPPHGRGPVSAATTGTASRRPPAPSSTSGTSHCIAGPTRRRSDHHRRRPGPATAPSHAGNGEGAGCHVLATVTATSRRPRRAERPPRGSDRRAPRPSGRASASSAPGGRARPIDGRTPPGASPARHRVGAGRLPSIRSG